jgi:cellulose synthase/poly-beta-1,6-N-acetylglucosamine synthase-like glycosyltransferase
MTALVHALVLLAAVCVLLPSLLLLCEVIAAHFGKSVPTAAANSVLPEPGVVIVMPAHNEAAGIEDTIRHLLPQLNAATRLLVVADNCTDNTYELVRAFAVRSHFVQVLERHDTVLRGKGYALHHGIEHLKASPPAIVVILDADCKISEEGVAILAAQCHGLGLPVQALYLMRNPEQNTGVASRLVEFAWVVKNQVRALGGRVLGVPCPLMGTGMAFNWAQISKAQLATGHLVEDMQLGVDLTLAGTPAAFCDTVLVTSEFPVSGEGQQTQRTRWEHGHLSVILSEVPKLLRRGLQNRNGRLLLAALDLAIPPLALLAILSATSFGAGILLWLWSGHSAAMVVSGMAVLSMVAGVAAAWSGFGRSAITLRELSFIPLYVMRKIPLYVFFLFKRQTAWVRSKREGEK